MANRSSPSRAWSEIELTNHPLTEITSLYMETSSVYGCGTVESDTLTVYVLGNLVSPVDRFYGRLRREHPLL